jgi:hypothetical protein
MSVGKISSIQFTGAGSCRGYDRSGSDDTGLNRGRIQERNNQSNYGNNVSNNQMRNAAKALVALMIGSAALGSTASLTSCAEAEADAYVNDSLLQALLNKKDSCCCCCPTQVVHDKDTLYLPGDTQYVDRTDTFYIKENFKSPVIDTLNAILHDLGNDTTGGYIPLRVSFIDEMDTKYKDHIFDGQSSAPNNVFYNGTNYPWSDEKTMFLIEPQYGEKVKYMLNLTGDGKLYVSKMIPKNGVPNPKSLEDYMFAFDSYVFDRDQAAKLIRKFNVAREQVGREDAGTLEKAALPKTIMLTNPYGTEWRWTNFNVVRGDAPTDLGE